MIKTKPVYINKWLLPFSWLYRFVVYVRNKMFSLGILKREEFDVPTICVGNITAGGTGKTPHTEYLIRLLQDKYRVGVLSRGYKRKSKGYVLATAESTSRDIGDESFQIKQKFTDTIVAVDGNRRRGIRQMLGLENPPQVIILDDALQHRYVNPSFTIILSDYNRPVYEDEFLPAGRLREPVSYLRVANMIIVTKCAQDLQPIDYRIIAHDINVFPYQSLYFTSFDYKKLKPVFGGLELPLEYLTNRDILLVTGIASPVMILEKLDEYTDKIQNITYPDHHNFRAKDIKYIIKAFENIISDNKIILVTEKDATRLVSRNDIGDDIKKRIYSLPIEVSFMTEEGEKDFIEKINKHVKQDSGNRSIHKK